MLVFCDNCEKQFNKAPAQIKKTKHNFCCRSCSGSFNGKRRNGPYGGEERKRAYLEARKLRKKNYGYRTISSKIDIPWTTIRSWTRDIFVDMDIARENAYDEDAKPFETLASSPARRKRLVKERGHKCERCNLETWFDEPIMLEMHHIDGNKENNTRENLILLCLNCHSQTPNFRNKSK